MSRTTPHDPLRAPAAEAFDVIVVGAGFSGLYMLHSLRERGLRVRLLEAADGVGGVWYWNRYPGARCDVESLFYSYSFSEELEQEWEWTERYPSQPEILRYLDHVADRFGLRPDISLNTRVRSAHFEEDGPRWRVTTERGEELTATWCVMATGCLSSARAPHFEGMEHFSGGVYRTAHWPHEGVDFTGRNVAVIGTGSSGIQAIPRIAEQAAQLTVLQRTPGFTMPAHNRPLTDAEQTAVKRDFRRLREEARRSATGNAGWPGNPGSAHDETPAEREERFREAWEAGHLNAMLSTYGDLMTDESANDTAAEFLRSRIRELVHDPETARKLTPHGHPFGAKRPCLDTGYYDTFNRPNVGLVDLRETPVTRISPKGVVTTGGEIPVDDIVLATGFDAMTGALLGMDIRGRGGRTLAEKWEAGPRTYLGLATAGFPNLLLVTGPGSPSVLSNVVVSIEQHVEWITGFLSRLTESGLDLFEADGAAEDAWVDHVNAVSEQTLYPRAASWYTGANVPGKPRVFMPYPGGCDVYRDKCDAVAAAGYEGFRLARA